MGVIKEERKELKYEAEKTALDCSHAIVAAQYQKEWMSTSLLDVWD